MCGADFERINIGDEIPSLRLPPLTRLVLAMYCGASGDFNPVHVDTDYARDIAGKEDVIGHGSLTMAWLGRLLTNRVSPKNIRSLNVRLLAPTHIGDRILCTGKVIEKDIKEGYIKVALQAETEGGRLLAVGTSVISIG